MSIFRLSCMLHAGSGVHLACSFQEVDRWQYIWDLFGRLRCTGPESSYTFWAGRVLTLFPFSFVMFFSLPSLYSSLRFFIFTPCLDNSPYIYEILRFTHLLSLRSMLVCQPSVPGSLKMQCWSPSEFLPVPKIGARRSFDYFDTQFKFTLFNSCRPTICRWVNTNLI